MPNLASWVAQKTSRVTKRKIPPPPPAPTGQAGTGGHTRDTWSPLRTHVGSCSCPRGVLRPPTAPGTPAQEAPRAQGRAGARHKGPAAVSGGGMARQRRHVHGIPPRQLERCACEHGMAIEPPRLCAYALHTSARDRPYVAQQAHLGNHRGRSALTLSGPWWAEMGSHTCPGPWGNRPCQMAPHPPRSMHLLGRFLAWEGSAAGNAAAWQGSFNASRARYTRSRVRIPRILCSSKGAGPRPTCTGATFFWKVF